MMRWCRAALWRLQLYLLRAAINCNRIDYNCESNTGLESLFQKSCGYRCPYLSESHSKTDHWTQFHLYMLYYQRYWKFVTSLTHYWSYHSRLSYYPCGLPYNYFHYYHNNWITHLYQCIERLIQMKLKQAIMPEYFSLN